MTPHPWPPQRRPRAKSAPVIHFERTPRRDVNEGSSYHRILKTSSVIAGASMVNIVVGIVRMKVAAVILGPGGIGLVGLFQNLIATAGSIAALGTGTVGIQRIAESTSAQGGDDSLAVRRALVWGTAALAALGTFIFWLLREPLAAVVVGDRSYAASVGWLALGVAFTVLCGTQNALLAGMRRIRGIAVLNVASSLCSTLVGVVVLYLVGDKGIVAFVLAIPIVTFAIGLYLTARLPAATGTASLHRIATQWNSMTRLGFLVMLASAAYGLSVLGMRSIVAHALGADALGHFHASWAISVVYAGLIFQAMGADYHPRLASALGDDARFNRTVNEQAEVLLLLAAPLLLAVLALAPWIIRIAYSAEFGEAVTLLRWQVLGDVLKVASWPIGFVNLVTGDSRRYFVAEIVASTVLFTTAWICLPHFGLNATGVAFFVMNLAYLLVVARFAAHRTGFRWQSRVRTGFLLLLGAAFAVFASSYVSNAAAAIIGMGLALLFGWHAMVRISRMTTLAGRLGAVANYCRRLTVKSRGVG